MKEGSKRVEEEEGRSGWRGRGGGEKKGKNLSLQTIAGQEKKIERSAEVCALQDLFLFLALISIKWASP